MKKHLIYIILISSIIFLSSMLLNTKKRTEFHILDFELMKKLGVDSFLNCWCGHLPITLDECKYIETLNVEEIKYSNDISILVNVFPNIKTLNIGNCYNIFDLKGIEKFKKLESLGIGSAISLSNNGFFDDGVYNINRIGNLNNLKKLTVCVAPFTSNSYEAIYSLKNLDSLILCDNTHFDLNSIINMKNLKYLACYPKDSSMFALYLTITNEQSRPKVYNAEKYLSIYKEADILNYEALSKLEYYKFTLLYKNGDTALVGAFNYGMQTGEWKYFQRNNSIPYKCEIYNKNKLVSYYYSHNQFYRIINDLSFKDDKYNIQIYTDSSYYSDKWSSHTYIDFKYYCPKSNILAGGLKVIDNNTPNSTRYAKFYFYNFSNNEYYRFSTWQYYTYINGKITKYKIDKNNNFTCYETPCIESEARQTFDSIKQKVETIFQPYNKHINQK